MLRPCDGHAQSVTRRQWTVRPTREDASGVRREAVQWVSEQEVPEPPIADLRLALAEAINNTVVHAFEGRESGTVTVSLTVDSDGREVHVKVIDDGNGMAPRPDSPGMGLGLPLMSALADHMEVRQNAENSGTEIAMTFKLDGRETGD